MGSLGERLKTERERQKLSLDDVAAATKIGSRMLKAIEDEHFDQLPGGIFNKGFVRSYARQLGLDEEQAVADYLAATSTVHPIKEPGTVLAALADRAAENRSVARPGGDALPWDQIAAVLLLVAFGFALWGWRTHKQKRGEKQSPNQIEVREEASHPPAEVPAQAMPASPPPGQMTPLAPAASPPLDRSASASGAASGGVQTASSMAAGSFILQIQARDDSWLQITADGKDIMNNLLPAGAQKSVEAQHEIIVKAGNVGGLEFTFNGKKLPLQGPTDEVKTIKFDATGVQVPVAVTHAVANPA